MLGWIALVLSLVGCVLNGRKQTACFPVWLTANACWLMYFGFGGQWSAVGENLMFVALNIYGWRQWTKKCNFVPPTPGYAPCTREKGHTGPCAHPFA